MRVLAFDTTTDACSAAVAVGPKVRARRFEVLGRGHVERLVAMVTEVMVEARLDFADLDLIAVTVGPGTFTGVRIGLAAARGFALAAGLPVAGFTTLEVLAGGLGEARGAGAGVIAAMDARRDQIYRQCFGPDRVALDGPAVVDRRDLAVPAGDWLAVGSGAVAYAGIAGVTLGRGPDLPDAAVLAGLAVERFAGTGVPLPKGLPDPLYLRPPDADLPGARP